MKRLLLLTVTALVLALPASTSAATIGIRITATAFSPKTVTINQGDSIKWTNADKVDHQLVANNGAFASPSTAGRFNYHDALKPTLTGTINVNGPPPSVTLGVNAPIVFYGDQVTVSGTVSNAKANEPVLILAEPYGSSAQQVAILMTGAGGAFTYTATPTILTNYSATWKGAASQKVTVQVRPHLTLSRTSRTRLSARITSTKSFARHFIYLQRRSSFGQWVTVEKLRLGPLSGRLFTAPHRKGTTTYRVFMTTNQAGLGYLATWSNSVRVRYRH